MSSGKSKNPRITVYCASSSKCRKEFLNAAYELGRYAALNSFDIVYGGGKAGLMGMLADGALSEGGYVEGVIPEFMIDLELEHPRVNIKRVKDMHTRQAIMEFTSDCCIALPGGSGTFLELMESISFKRLGLIISPIIIVNLENYYDPMLEMLERAIGEKFMSRDHYNLWKETKTIDETLQYLLSKFPSTYRNSARFDLERYHSELFLG